MGLPHPGRPSVQDASLVKSIALPVAVGAPTSVETANLDLGLLHGISMRPENCELLAQYPALTLAQLPNTSVMTYAIQASADPTFATGVRTLGTATQTGKTGTAKQPAGYIRCRVPSDCPEFVQLAVTNDAAAGNASAASASLELVF